MESTSVYIPSKNIVLMLKHSFYVPYRSYQQVVEDAEGGMGLQNQDLSERMFLTNSKVLGTLLQASYIRPQSLPSSGL